MVQKKLKKKISGKDLREVLLEIVYDNVLTISRTRIGILTPFFQGMPKA